MTLRVTILGCGSSGGVPRIGNDWGACDPNISRNRRRRCSILVQRFGQNGSTTTLIDTAPDLRQQLLDVNVGEIDGVLFTHDHADHTHGIDELRVLVYRRRARINAYFDKNTATSIKRRFDYCFETPAGSDYPPILIANEIIVNKTIEITGNGGTITFLPFLQHHGSGFSLGFRFDSIAYSSDVSDLPASSLPVLRGLDTWIVDALRYTRHPSHFTVDQALDWIKELRPKRAILTHLHVDLDYETLRLKLPDGVEPAFDGHVIESKPS